MADLSITAANVAASANATKETGTAGETITAGQAVYYLASTNRYMLAHSETSAATAAVVGIALHGASNGQPLTIVKQDDDLDLGATLAIGATYVLSASGGISPDADATNIAPDFKTVIGVAAAADSLVLRIAKSGVAVA